MITTEVQIFPKSHLKLYGMPKISRSYFKIYEKTSWKVENSNTTLLSRSFSHVNLDFLNYGFILSDPLLALNQRISHMMIFFRLFKNLYEKWISNLLFLWEIEIRNMNCPSYSTDFWSCLIISKWKQLFLILLLCTAKQN